MKRYNRMIFSKPELIQAEKRQLRDIHRDGFWFGFTSGVVFSIVLFVIYILTH